MTTRTTIIAEAGVNHNGSVDIARELIDVAVEAGATAVKFQTFRADRLASRRAAKADYQARATGSDTSQLHMLRALELDRASHVAIADHCRRREIEFMSSPFDEDSVDMLKDLGVSRIKIPSGELTNGPLLLKVARTGLPVLLSTGMATLGEVEAALGVLAFGMAEPVHAPKTADFLAGLADPEIARLLLERTALLHCTTAYPTPHDEVNLLAMRTLSLAFQLRVGYSDHTEGIAVPIAAVACGASVVEKHFTLDRGLPGPDQATSLEPAELAEMVRHIRTVEEALGSPLKQPTTAEIGNRSIVRRSLVASHPIRKGERFSAENMTSKRPAGGISPMQYWQWIGQFASRDYSTDEPLDSFGPVRSEGP